MQVEPQPIDLDPCQVIGAGARWHPGRSRTGCAGNAKRQRFTKSIAIRPVAGSWRIAAARGPAASSLRPRASTARSVVRREDRIIVDRFRDLMWST